MGEIKTTRSVQYKKGFIGHFKNIKPTQNHLHLI